MRSHYFERNQLAYRAVQSRGRAGASEDMSAVTIQESFFTAALEGRRHVTLYLASGAKITGTVLRFDKYAVILESIARQHLVFKHSISAAFLCDRKQCESCQPHGVEEGEWEGTA